MLFLCTCWHGPGELSRHDRLIVRPCVLVQAEYLDGWFRTPALLQLALNEHGVRAGLKTKQGAAIVVRPSRILAQVPVHRLGLGS